jgi:hypothetical protein
LVWPGYDQEQHVSIQRFTETDPAQLLALVVAFNQHLAHLFAHFPAEADQIRCTIGNEPPCSLTRLAEDYVAHFDHHWRQLLNAEAKLVTFSGLAWPPPPRA